MALDNLFKVTYTTFEMPVKRDMAVTYLRLQNSHNTTHVSFCLGYSRVTPIKPVTIPCLELTVTVLAVHIDKMLKLFSCFWTDSTISVDLLDADKAVI